jgi:hypothetical protein
MVAIYLTTPTLAAPQKPVDAQVNRGLPAGVDSATGF